MITNVGKNILAKYLVGQTTSYASHIAIGCGTKPVASDHTFSPAELLAMKNKESLEFEMIRMPIVSRGFVDEDGLSKVVLTAELPTQERYEITEVGIFSAASNPAAGAFDSRVVYSFSDTDNWKYSIDGGSSTDIFVEYGPLDGEGNNGNIIQTPKVFATNADNRIFTNENRVNRNERCRFLNNIIAMRGDTANLQYSPLDSPLGGSMFTGTASDWIILDATSLDFTKNSPLDELKLAFSVVNKVPGTTLVPAIIPDNVKILLEFSHLGSNLSTQYAKFEVDIDHTGYQNGTSDNSHDFENNRYVVVGKKFQELNKSLRFSWAEVTTAKISVTVTKNNLPSDAFYVCLDALRLENNTATNSLYGLTGYSVIKNVQSRPIIKSANTTNYIEFRFALDV
jgi:hypothetical protein